MNRIKIYQVFRESVKVENRRLIQTAYNCFLKITTKHAYSMCMYLCIMYTYKYVWTSEDPELQEGEGQICGGRAPTGVQGQSPWSEDQRDEVP